MAITKYNLNDIDEVIKFINDDDEQELLRARTYSTVYSALCKAFYTILNKTSEENGAKTYEKKQGVYTRTVAVFRGLVESDVEYYSELKKIHELIKKLPDFKSKSKTGEISIALALPKVVMAIPDTRAYLNRRITKKVQKLKFKSAEHCLKSLLEIGDKALESAKEEANSDPKKYGAKLERVTNDWAFEKEQIKEFVKKHSANEDELSRYRLESKTTAYIMTYQSRDGNTKVNISNGLIVADSVYIDFPSSRNENLNDSWLKERVADIPNTPYTLIFTSKENAIGVI